MGYYITLKECNVAIPRAMEGVALKALHALDNYDQLKSGGEWGGPGGTKKRAWYAWMPTDLTSITTLEEFLQNIGFETRSDDVEITITGYDSKTGAEQIFMWAIAPYVILADKESHDDPYMFWQGEDGSMWRWTFVDGELHEESAMVHWDRTGVWNPVGDGGFVLHREAFEEEARS